MKMTLRDYLGKYDVDITTTQYKQVLGMLGVSSNEKTEEHLIETSIEISRSY